jgi:hypothetical protein
MSAQLMHNIQYVRASVFVFYSIFQQSRPILTQVHVVLAQNREEPVMIHEEQGRWIQAQFTSNILEKIRQKLRVNLQQSRMNIADDPQKIYFCDNYFFYKLLN